MKKKCVQIQQGLAKKNHAQMINILPNRIAEKWACGWLNMQRTYHFMLTLRIILNLYQIDLFTKQRRIQLGVVVW